MNYTYCNENNINSHFVFNSRHHAYPSRLPCWLWNIVTSMCSHFYLITQDSSDHMTLFNCSRVQSWGWKFRPFLFFFSSFPWLVSLTSGFPMTTQLFTHFSNSISWTFAWCRPIIRPFLNDSNISFMATWICLMTRNSLPHQLGLSGWNTLTTAVIIQSKALHYLPMQIQIATTCT